ncbi:2,3-bisphosphoglycerate-dependent phosphoglycerate mutase [Estrella lausannensis]|uniref:2,3-bisphosphoglycerate-dependent phosphoglycerate mutase n=1 Tax=Estrella lausannensis TaxID=483423 RepID=A0A0H5DQM4_9BACT|nr:2,3-bisphosphoglycerate-dependent phosphoglycerate mutase [Estrella lausannensis]CRX38961.1 2,3-bisphosphoglycerate-dependent phosphoglycerate mutase [Estrella lausannensis]
MALLIMLRHGESEWNRQNQFTGWVDVPLSSKGVEEALKAGELIKDIPIDVIFTSTLIRAQMTLALAMLKHVGKKVPVFLHEGEGDLEKWGKIYSPQAESHTIPVYKSWRLNERMYGELQGLNKAETAEKFGKDQVKIWRRSYATPPPSGESLEMTAARTIPYFEETIVPFLRQGKNVFVSAHGNSLRSIIMDLEGLSQEEVVSLELATGSPLLYEYNEGVFTKKELQNG